MAPFVTPPCLRHLTSCQFTFNPAAAAYSRAHRGQGSQPPISQVGQSQATSSLQINTNRFHLKLVKIITVRRLPRAQFVKLDFAVDSICTQSRKNRSLMPQGQFKRHGTTECNLICMFHFYSFFFSNFH